MWIAWQRPTMPRAVRRASSLSGSRAISIYNGPLKVRLIMPLTAPPPGEGTHPPNQTGISAIIKMLKRGENVKNLGRWAGDCTHSANFDEKVHKPQSWCDASRTLVVLKMKSNFHTVNKQKMLGSKTKFYILYMSSTFHFRYHNFSRHQKSQASLCSDLTEMLE